MTLYRIERLRYPEERRSHVLCRYKITIPDEKCPMGDWYAVASGTWRDCAGKLQSLHPSARLFVNRDKLVALRNVALVQDNQELASYEALNARALQAAPKKEQA